MYRMWSIMRFVGSAMLIDRAIGRLKEVTKDEPSLDRALERFQKAHEEMLKMEVVIQAKHRKLKSIVNRAKKEV